VGKKRLKDRGTPRRKKKKKRLTHGGPSHAPREAIKQSARKNQGVFTNSRKEKGDRLEGKKDLGLGKTQKHTYTIGDETKNRGKKEGRRWSAKPSRKLCEDWKKGANAAGGKRKRRGPRADSLGAPNESRNSPRGGT